MPELGPDNARWFAESGETHPIRPVTPEEAAAFKVRRSGFDKLLTVIRGYDGVQATYAFLVADPIERAMDVELAGCFDCDLDARVAGDETGG